RSLCRASLRLSFGRSRSGRGRLLDQAHGDGAPLRELEGGKLAVPIAQANDSQPQQWLFEQSAQERPFHFVPILIFVEMAARRAAAGMEAAVHAVNFRLSASPRDVAPGAAAGDEKTDPEPLHTRRQGGKGEPPRIRS